MENIKKYLNKIVLALLLSTSFLFLNSAVVVKQLISLQQKTSDCAYFAAFNADCMVNGQDINHVQSLLLEKQNFESKLADFKLQAGNATDIDGHTLEVCVLPFISNDKITIIEGFEQLLQKDFIPESLTIGITNFKLHGTPHAVLYNMGGHWIALGMIKDNKGQTIIIQADSAGKGDIESEITPAEDYLSNDGTIEDILYQMFDNDHVAQETFIPQTKDPETIAREEEDLRLAREMQKQLEQKEALRKIEQEEIRKAEELQKLKTAADARQERVKLQLEAAQKRAQQAAEAARLKEIEEQEKLFAQFAPKQNPQEDEESLSLALAMQLQFENEAPAEQNAPTETALSDEEFARLLQEQDEQTQRDAEFARRLQAENAQPQRRQPQTRRR